MLNVELLREDLYTLFQEVEAVLPSHSVGFIQELIEVDEWGLALETIYDHLSDNEVIISRTAYNLVQQLANLMTLGTRDWQLLLVKEG